jgi:hypothetical protein
MPYLDISPAIGHTLAQLGSSSGQTANEPVFIITCVVARLTFFLKPASQKGTPVSSNDGLSQLAEDSMAQHT